MKITELNKILTDHEKWCLSEGGNRADLSGANLSGADLSGADLRSADLSGADLSKTILSGINWLAWIGIIPDANGKARAYKVVTQEGVGTNYSGINYLESEDVEGDSFDNDVNKHCSHGINLATFQWCLNAKLDPNYRLLMMEFDASPDNVCVPIGTDGKFRVRKAHRVGECEWNGNLLNGRQ